ncbi:MAG: hypothetical protein D6759_14895, partial [Chloroflexi bacterium]
VLAIALSDVEIFANLEFTQAFYDAFSDDPAIDLAGGNLTLADFQKHALAVINRLTAELTGRLTLITGDALEAILRDVRALNQDEERLGRFLRDLNTQSASFVVA